MNAEVERIRAIERTFVAGCITIFGIVCVIMGKISGVTNPAKEWHKVLQNFLTKKSATLP